MWKLYPLHTCSRRKVLLGFFVFFFLFIIVDPGIRRKGCTHIAKSVSMSAVRKAVKANSTIQCAVSSSIYVWGYASVSYIQTYIVLMCCFS